MSFSPLDSGLLGPLFVQADMRETFADAALLNAMLQAEAALARAQSGFGLVPVELAAAIAAIRAEDLDIAALGRETALSGVPTIPFVKAVQARLPKHLEPAFHKGTTTQDILDTAYVLQFGHALDLIAEDLAAVLHRLADMARTYRSAPCIGRTYGQHAAPITFGFKVAVWLSAMLRLAQRLPILRKDVLVASLGGPVGTLSGFGLRGPDLVQAYARELGLEAPNISWHAARGRMLELGVWLAELIGAMAKMATDVAQLAMTEVGEVSEPHAPGRGGSSAMPHKRNPVSATVILAAHAASIGHATTLMQAMAAAHERPIGLWHAEWHALPQLFGLSSGALREARTLAAGLVVDTERMGRNIDITRGLIFTDTVSARLADQRGKAIAHAFVAEAAEEVRRTGRHLRDVLIERGIEESVLVSAFDLHDSVAAAAGWADRIAAEAEELLMALGKGR